MLAVCRGSHAGARERCFGMQGVRCGRVVVWLCGPMEEAPGLGPGGCGFDPHRSYASKRQPRAVCRAGLSCVVRQAVERRTRSVLILRQVPVRWSLGLRLLCGVQRWGGYERA